MQSKVGRNVKFMRTFLYFCVRNAAAFCCFWFYLVVASFHVCRIYTGLVLAMRTLRNGANYILHAKSHTTAANYTKVSLLTPAKYCTQYVGVLDAKSDTYDAGPKHTHNRIHLHIRHRLDDSANDQ